MKIQKLILICSMASALFLLGCNKTRAPKNSQVASPKKTKSEQLERQEAGSLLKELRQKNPFRPDHSDGLAQGPKVDTGLKGIIWDSQKPFALIGDSVVGEGDIVDGKMAMKINKDSVVLDNNGKEEVLRLELVPK